MKEIIKGFVRGAMAAIGVAIICGGVFGVYACSTIENTEITETNEIITYKTKTEYDNTQREGIRTTKQEGINGNKTVTYEVKSNLFGKETSRTKIDEVVNKQEQDKIVVVGTKKVYTCSNGTEYENKVDKDECENRISWEKSRDKALRECNADSSKFNCWYDEYPGTYLHWSYYTAPSYSYTPAVGPSAGFRQGAICHDGWISSATGRGACSHHGGVRNWF